MVPATGVCAPEDPYTSGDESYAHPSEWVWAFCEFHSQIHAVDPNLIPASPGWHLIPDSPGWLQYFSKRFKVQALWVLGG